MVLPRPNLKHELVALLSTSSVYHVMKSFNDLGLAKTRVRTRDRASGQVIAETV